MVPVLVCLLLAVFGGRQLAASETRFLIAPLDGATVSSASDDGLLAVASRTPVPAQEARLHFGVATALSSADVLMLMCMAALAVGSGRLMMDMLGVRVRRRGPPALLAI